MKLFHRLILRPLRRDLARTLLTLLSIALGVAVVIAIELAGDAAAGSFESSLVSLTGPVDYLISANGGVEEKYAAALAALPLNARFAPVMERAARVDGVGFTTLYGIDAVSQGLNSTAEGTPQAHSVVISSDLAARVPDGKWISVQGRRFPVARVVARQNTSWLGMDIADTQDLLQAYGRLDRIEVFLGHEDAGRALAAIRKTLPPTYEVETPGARSDENRRMLRAFRWNLRVLSYISLLVGAFLIYNTIAVSVVRRRTEIGILRAVGTSARGVLLIFLGEAAMLGLAGSFLGLALGRVMAALIVGMISDTVNALFTTSAPGVVTVTWESAVGALFAGTAVAFFSALIPAREAARVAPADAMRREAREHHTTLHVRRDFTWAAICGGAAAVLGQFGPIEGRPVLGYVAALFAVAAAALVSPAFVLFAIRLLPLKRVAGAAGLVAGRSLSASLARTSIVVTALATAIAMMVSVGVMVGSFRETVQVWLAGQLRADIYLRAAGPSAAGIFPPIDNAVPAVIRGTAGVMDVDVFHAFTFRYEGVRATFGAGDIELVRRYRSLRFLAGGMDSMAGRDRAIVSEPFANKHRVKVGDTLRIPLGNTPAPLLVTGIYYDYASDQGYVIVDRATLLRYLPGQPITNIAVYVKPGADAGAVRRSMEKRLREYPLSIEPNETLRRGAVEVFDRTFAITYALEAVAILVAMLGAANSLLALVLDRKREIGLIRYLGGARDQVRRMILTQAGVIGLLASSLGLALGMALSLLLIYVINKQSFGWTIQFHPPVPLVAGALLLVWLVTVLAGIYPARFAAKLEPAEAVHEE